MTPEAVFRNAFHAHLDACAQCENHPFALCEVGALLLRTAVVTQRSPWDVHATKKEPPP